MDPTFLRKIVKISNLTFVRKFTENLLKCNFFTFLFVSVHDIIIGYYDQNSLIEPEIEKVMAFDFFKESGRAFFISDRPSEYKIMTTSQVSKLVSNNSIECLMGSHENYHNLIFIKILSLDELNFCNKPYVIYIDNSLDRLKEFAKLMESNEIPYTCFYLEKQNYFMSFFYKEYEILI